MILLRIGRIKTFLRINDFPLEIFINLLEFFKIYFTMMITSSAQKN